MAQPLVSAIVLNTWEGKEAVRCVQALLAQTLGNKVEVIVVDNHSGDDSIGIIRTKFFSEPRVRIVEARENLGYGKGNGLGARYATGKYLLIINPDNIVESATLERFIAAYEADPTIGILAPKLVHEDGTVRDSFRAFPTIADIFIKRTFLKRIFRDRMRHYLQDSAIPSHPIDSDWVAGAVLFVRRDLFEELQGFDPRFFLFFEDADLCRRCWERGLRVVYDPSITVRDRKARLSEGGILSILRKKTGRAHLISAVKYFWKWRGTSSPRA